MLKQNYDSEAYAHKTIDYPKALSYMFHLASCIFVYILILK